MEPGGTYHPKNGGAMIRARAVIGERERLSALRGSALEDAPPDAVLDRITALAASIFDVPMALVSLLDETRQRVLSRFGLELESVPRELSFCEHTLSGDGVMVVPDALADPRFRSNPYVLDLPKVRFYAGAPIVADDGSKLGSICILDVVPRTISAFQVGVLEQIAELVV
jgi:GAF domain-containing protein